MSSAKDNAYLEILNKKIEVNGIQIIPIINTNTIVLHWYEIATNNWSYLLC